MSTEEKLAGVIGWLAELDYPGVGDQMQALSDAASAISRLSAEVQELREALNIGVMAFTDIAQFRPSGPLDNFQQIASHARATTLEALPPMRAALKPETGK